MTDMAMALSLAITLVVVAGALVALHWTLKYWRECFVSETREAAIRATITETVDVHRRRIDAVVEAVSQQAERLTQLANRKQGQ